MWHFVTIRYTSGKLRHITMLFYGVYRDVSPGTAYSILYPILYTMV